VDKWFAELPARKALILSLEPARAPAQKAIDTLNKAAADGIADLHRVVAKAEDRPELEPIDIKVEIKASEPANTVFDSSDDFITATRKLQAIKALAAEDDDGKPRPRRQAKRAPRRGVDP
jgi:hypothetical protein